MRYASVCSGVEAASLAWMPLGWEAVWFSEIEPFPCAVLKERFPDVPNLGDMTKIEGEKYRGKIDLLVGGTPCQDLSIAGKRAGFGGKRSSLALDFVRLAYESGCKWIVWENVPGVFSSRGGGDFAAFLSLLSGSKVEIPDRGFAASGFVCNARRDRYGLAWRVLDAQFTRVSGFSFAVPQRRRRVFVVGYFGDWTRAAEVLLEPDRVQWDTPPRRVKGEGVAPDAKGSIRETGSGVFWNGNDYAETLKANCDRDRMPDKGKLNCVIDTRCKNPNGSTLVMATGQANAETATDHCVNLTCNHEAPIICAGFSGGQGEKAGGIGYEDEVSPTIRSAESGSNQIPDILCQYGDIAGALTDRHDSSPCADRGMSIVYENHAQDSRVKPCGECSPQINAKAGTGGGNLPLVQAVAVAENIIGRKENNGGNGTGAQEELAYTQNATGVMGVSVNTSVRRLLPIETERLMGFPDNHTRIPWRGKPEEQCPDGPRYKACGNSMCVNVMRWIGMRIDNLERRMKGN